MAEVIKPSPTADKMITIICNRLLLKREAIRVDTTFEELGIYGNEKEYLIRQISDKFLIPTENKLLNLQGADNVYIKDTWNNHLKRIKTIWNVLQFIEANDDYNNRPAAYNI